MKVIDAINKINKEEKFRFRLLCDGDIYKYIGGSLYNETTGERAEWIIDNRWLNEEIEIIEEEKKIPEKLNIEDDGNAIVLFGEKENEWTILDNVDVIVCDKINEIIDYLKSKGE